MNAQQILNAAFATLMQDHWCGISPTATYWEDEEAEHWLMQIAMGMTLGVQLDEYKGKTLASPCLR